MTQPFKPPSAESLPPQDTANTGTNTPAGGQWLAPSSSAEVDKTVSAQAPAAALAGQSFGDFELLEEVGRGGMGIVYKARQKSLGRMVAVKVLPADLQKPIVLSRFLAEAQAAAALAHPNIVTIYHAGQCPAGHYYVMEFLEGQSLDRLVQQRVLPIPWIVNAMIRVSEAVHFAHTKGIIHRDLKPANVMIDRFRGPIVLDFGIAKILGNTSGQQTECGVIMGTPAFMPPEQAQDGAAPVSQLSDVYSLGAIMYTMLTRRVPYDGATPLASILKVISPDMPPPIRSFRDEVPVELEQIVMKCIAKKPAERFASAQALAEQLRRFRVSAQPAPAVAPLPALPSRLLVVAGPDQGRVFLLEGGANLLIGRSRAAAACLSDPSLSRIHCMVESKGGQVFVTDFESTSGTFVNGKRIEQAQLLQPNDVLQVGATQLRYLSGVAPASVPAPKSAGSLPEIQLSPAPPTVNEAAAAQDDPPVGALPEEIKLSPETRVTYPNRKVSKKVDDEDDEDTAAYSFQGGGKKKKEDPPRPKPKPPAKRPVPESFEIDSENSEDDATSGSVLAGIGNIKLDQLLELEKSSKEIKRFQVPKKVEKSEPEVERVLPGPSAKPKAATPTAPEKPAAPTSAGPEKPALPVVVLVSKTGKQVRLRKSTTVIGSGPGCNLTLKSSSVSERHCRIVILPDRVVLDDLNSERGTNLNGRSINRATLQDGDQLSLGDIPFQVLLSKPSK